MNNHEVIAVADHQIQLALEELIKKLSNEIKAIQAEAANRGSLRSGAYILNVQKACANIVIEFGDQAWNILFRCVSTVGIVNEDNIASQLKSTIDKHFPESIYGLRSNVNDAARIAGMPDVLSKIPDEINDARLTALRKIHSEIDLFVLKLKNNPIEKAYVPSQINFHNSNIGAFQTGAASIVNVSQQIDSQGIQEIIKALSLVQKELTSVETLPNINKLEIIEIVDDGIHELNKDKPNLSKAKSFISAIGEAISFTADLKPAYETLKAAAIMIGLTLP